MKKKILIIGKNSFIGSHLFFDLKKKFFVNKISFYRFMHTNKNSIKKYNYIVNCTSNRGYLKKKYDQNNDFDFKIAEKIYDLDIKFIFLSSRKVYKPQKNIKENSKTKPFCNYSKNKLVSEKKLSRLLKKKLLILRISNIIGIHNKKSNRKLHNTFVDIFFSNVKKGVLFRNKKIYKDFLSIYKFCEIIRKLIDKNSYGIYNISVGKPVFLEEITNWLNFYNKKPYRIIDFKSKKSLIKESFYLNNKKLMKKINVKNRLIDLERDCKKISKLFFKKK